MAILEANAQLCNDFIERSAALAVGDTSSFIHADPLAVGVRADFARSIASAALANPDAPPISWRFTAYDEMTGGDIGSMDTSLLQTGQKITEYAKLVLCKIDEVGGRNV